MSMSLARAFLVVTQATAYQLASTPPNKTPAKARFDSGHPWYIRIAALVFRLQQPLIWTVSVAELSLILAQQTDHIPPYICHTIQHSLCSHRQTITPSIKATPFNVLGALFITFGSMLRLFCFHKLGRLFTFDLTILPSHTLITTGPYAYVRHPAYAGSLFIHLGLILTNFTAGSWVTECGITGSTAIGLYFASIWFIWWFIVGVARCRSEDAELRKMFPKEWGNYASTVQSWMIPGLL